MAKRMSVRVQMRDEEKGGESFETWGSFHNIFKVGVGAPDPYNLF